MAKADLYKALKALNPTVPLMRCCWFDFTYEEDDSGKDFYKPTLLQACPLTQLALANNLLTVEELVEADDKGLDEEQVIYTPLRKCYHVQTRSLDEFVRQWDEWTDPIGDKLAKQDIDKLVDELAKL